MGEKVKIIYLLCHLPNPIIKNIREPEEYTRSIGFCDFIRLSEPPFWVGFFNDHHVVAAQELKKQTDEYEIECWRPYGYGLKVPYQKKVEGILHRVFPATQMIIPQFGKYVWSKSLYKELIYEIKNNNVILKISVGHAWFHIILMIKLKKYKNQFGLVALHLSSGFKKFAYLKLSPIKKLFKWYYLVEHWIDVKSLYVSDIYYSGSLVEAKYLEKKHPALPARYLMEGIDFSNYIKLPKTKKKDLRKELGLPVNKNLFIVHGNWRSTDYNYGPLIQCYKRVKKSSKANNLQMIMIGGYKTEDLFQEASEAGAIMIERCSKGIFIKYLQAGDFFGKPNLDYAFINFGGFGFSTIEALACGLPVISNNIMHFPGTEEEVRKIGIDMQTERKLEEAIIFMNLNFDKYSECRDIAKKYFDIKNTSSILINKYKELETKYFSK